MEGLTIRPLERSDAEAVERIVSLSPEAARWSPDGYLALPGWVAEESEGVEGFLFARVAADEMEVLNLAVEPAGRERGVGGALLAAARGPALERVLLGDGVRSGPVHSSIVTPRASRRAAA